jgi:hypothetical protein
MMTAAILALSVVAADAATSPDGAPRHDSSALRAHLDSSGPWCQGRLRIELTLENLTGRPIWIGLGHPSAGPLEWTPYMYSYPGGGVGVGGSGDTDVPTVLSFLRSDFRTRLDPGASVSWLLRLGRQSLRAGPATVSIWGPVLGTEDLADSHFTVYDVRAELSVTLRRSGRCYVARLR